MVHIFKRILISHIVQKKLYKILCIVAFLLLDVTIPIKLNAQDEIGHLEIYGLVQGSKKPIKDATISVYEGRKLVLSDKTNAKGQFKLDIEFDKEYRLKIEKDGYISATWYEFKTTLLKDDYKYWIHSYEIVEELFPEVEGVDKKLLENRTVFIDFDNRYEGFVVNLTKTGTTFERNRELKKQVELILKNTEKYNKAIAEADMLYKAKKYEKAIESYQEAASLLPNKKYPKDQIALINDLLKSMRNLDENYRKFIAEADRSFNSLQYERALTSYEKASALKPEEQYPKVQIEKIKLLLAESKNKQQAYDQAIAQADEKFNANQYSEAKPLYEKASNIFPNEPYPKEQIRKINSLLANQTKMLEEYNKAVADGDRNFGVEKYLEAKKNFQKANSIFPDKPYPIEKIAEIDKILAELKGKQASYDQAIAQGDAAFNAKEYSTAQKAYQTASNIFPNEKYPKDKLNEIAALLAKIKNQDDAYSNLIALADQAFIAKNYTSAKTNYQQALGVKPNEQYPKDRIAEIDRILAEQKSKDDAYSQAISQADYLFNQKKYGEALPLYQKASNIKPAEQYPKDKINEINGLLADQKNKKDAYNNAIAQADQYFNQKAYEDAKASYQVALGILPNEQYPKDKIAEINSILANIQKQNNDYSNAIAQADQLFAQKDYKGAKPFYQKAVNIKPNEQYPKDKIAEINRLLTEMQGKQQAYQNAIAEADRLFNEKQWENSKSSYQAASNIFPQEQYPKDRIAEINNILASILSKQQAYDKAIAEGDKAFNEKRYQPSLLSYQNALNIFPGKEYPQNRINQINQILADLKIKEEQYKQAVAQGDMQFGQQQYENAKTSFETAYNLFPERPYPKEKLDEINKILADKLSNQQAYDKAIAEGDRNFNAKSYDIAKSNYQSALRIFPSKKYPKDKIAEIDAILAQIAQVNKQYDEAILKGDNAFNAKSYDDARTYYQTALQLKPDEQYPKDKINQINQLLADYKQKDEAYKQAIAQADQAFNNKQYLQAKGLYQQALGIFPGKEYPAQKISEIEEILSQLKDKEDRYNQAIANADKLFNSRSYESAKSGYQQALSILPNKQYPKDKIAEIDNIVAQQLADQKAKEAEYNQTIAQADQAFNAMQYPQAKGLYQKALGIYPSKEYPAQKISEIEEILSQLKDKEDRYNQAIANADKLFDSRSYESAKSGYQQALSILPNKQYPKDKIAEIDNIIAQQLADQKAKEAEYNQTIAQADQAFNAKQYAQAKGLYQKALGIYPSKEYPAQKISEIEEILSQLKDKEDRYNQAIANADKLFDSRSYESAKSGYQQALSILPNKQYPKDKIAEIDNIIAQQLADQKAKEAEYNQTIAQADQAFNAKQYAQAKGLYQKALGIYPSKEYPAQKINEIDNILAEIANKKDQYNRLIQNADKLFNSKSYESSKSVYQDALALMPNEQYPKDKIASINQILGDMQAKRASYNNAIAQADQAFNAKQYAQAKQFYQNALNILPSEQYPKSRINEIEQLLAEQDKRAQYDNIIAKADSDFKSSQYQSALSGYQNASSIYPNEQYPKDQIDKIKQLLEELEGKKRDYNKAIADADNSFNNKIYDKARNKYNEALQLFPNEQYPKDKIAEINKILQQLATVNSQYNAAISDGDAKFEEAKFEEARSAYQLASGYKPEEQYPKERIEQIDRLLSDMKQKEEDYNKAIAEGNKNFGAKNWADAKTAFTTASAIYPNEEYPKKKLQEINAIINSQQGQQQAYNRYISQGDQYIRNKSYDLAIQSFKNALKIRPNEKYPKAKLTEIDQILADNKDIQKFYARGYLDVATNTKIERNNDKKFSFISFDQKKLGSYAIIKIKNLSGKPLNIFLNYGKGFTKHGGFTFKIDESTGVKDYKINLSTHAQWITQRNNWISLYPAGGSIEVQSIRIYFGSK